MVNTTQIQQIRKHIPHCLFLKILFGQTGNFEHHDNVAAWTEGVALSLTGKPKISN